MDTKDALYETGIRIPQFAHYPAKIPTGTTLDAPASTVDVAATMIDYAGIESTYQRDGMSWKDVIRDQARKSFWKDERCLLFEVDYDCAIRCGCYKFMDIENTDGNTWVRGGEKGLRSLRQQRRLRHCQR